MFQCVLFQGRTTTPVTAVTPITRPIVISSPVPTAFPIPYSPEQGNSPPEQKEHEETTEGPLPTPHTLWTMKEKYDTLFLVLNTSVLPEAESSWKKFGKSLRQKHIWEDIEGEMFIKSLPEFQKAIFLRKSMNGLMNLG